MRWGHYIGPDHEKLYQLHHRDIMAIFGMFLLLSYICLVINEEASARGSFQVNLLSYSALDMQIFEEECCGRQSGYCQQPCHICVVMDLSVVMGTSVKRQVYRTIRSVTKSIDVVNEGKGTATVESNKNGIMVASAPLQKWRVKVKLYHHQNGSSCQRTRPFEEFNKKYMITEAKKEKNTLRGNFINLTLQTSFQCYKNWFGKRCDTFCIEADDDVTGHYTCESGTGKKECLTNYYGDQCTHYCKYRNDEYGHFRCGKNGEKICLKGWTNRTNGCNNAEGEMKCHFYSRWVQMMTSNAETAKRVWRSLKYILCSTINKNCFGNEICPKTSKEDLVAVNELLIYNASLETNDITLRLEVKGKNRCLWLNETCLNLNHLPRDNRVKMIITYAETALQPHSNSHKSHKRKRMVLYSLIGLFLLVIFMIILDRILKPREVVNTVRETLTPNVRKRTRM